MPRKILVTSALPYANGPLHLGHIIETVQTDIWVRFQRMQGHDCIYVCAEDSHGTPVMIKAQAEGVTPEQLITAIAVEHKADYQGFLIGHDHFHTTHSPENQAIIFEPLQKLKGDGDDLTPGLGIGLTLVRDLVQTLGHELALRSEWSQGSVFSITLPRAPNRRA